MQHTPPVYERYWLKSAVRMRLYLFSSGSRLERLWSCMMQQQEWVDPAQCADRQRLPDC